MKISRGDKIQFYQLKFLRNEEGMGMVIVLVVASLITMMFFTNLNLVYQQKRQVIYTNSKLTANMLKNNFYQLLKNDTSWATIVSEMPDSSEKNCLKNRDSSCDAFVNNELDLFKIYDASGSTQAIYDSTNDNVGIDLAGDQCNTFVSTVPGNPSCPFRYNFKWRVECSSAPCSGKPILVWGDLIFNPGEVMPLNVKTFRVEMIKN